jgi:hypothetical protein
MNIKFTIKCFLRLFDVLVSKAFFHSQASAIQVARDSVNSLIRLGSISCKFDPKIGFLSGINLPEFENVLADTRGNAGAGSEFSLSYRLNVIPKYFDDVISNNIDIINDYLGSGFLHEDPLVFRNYNIPVALESYDLISNVWHQDSHDGNRLLKIFVLLQDVGVKDGPFMFLNHEATRLNWADLYERWDFPKMKKLPHFKDEVQAIGPKGTYLIINTASCMHRASIPEKHRDLMQITLYPKWRSGIGRKVYVVK